MTIIWIVLGLGALVVLMALGLILMGWEMEGKRIGQGTGKRIRKALAILLTADAGIVAVGLALGQNMWGWIFGYWTLLAIKNAAEMIMSKEEKQ